MKFQLFLPGILVTLMLLGITFPVSHGAIGFYIENPIADTNLYLGLPDDNNGGDPGFAVGPSTTDEHNRALIQFDLSSIPAGSTITLAQLQLRFTGGSLLPSPSGELLTAYRVLEEWAEDEATWNNRLKGPDIEWTTKGGTYTGANLATATVPAGYGLWMTFTVTGIVKAWVEGGEPNHGFLINSLRGFLT